MRGRGRGGARAAGVLALALAVLPAADPCRAQFIVPTDFVDEPVVAGLPEVVGMAFIPDGRLLVIERATARVRLIVNGALATVDPVMTVPDVDASYGEEGLLGIAVDPAWPSRPYFYVQHTVAGAPFIRIARYTVTGDLAFTGDGSLSAAPASRHDVIADAPHEAEFHNGGTLRFGPDGMLYSSLGDYTLCGAQILGDLHGEILRLDVSGLPDGPGGPPPRALITPPGNPFATHPDAEARLVWHWGLRNPFRFGIDPESGEMVVGDVGGSQREELNHAATPGLNFEWPIYEGEVPGPLTCAGVDSSAFTGPIATYDHSEGAAIIGGVIYRRGGAAPEPFPPEYDGDIFYADFYGTWIRRLKRDGGLWAPAPAPGQPNATDWGAGEGLVSDWLVGPDGALWYCQMLTAGGGGPGRIRRIRYAGSLSAPAPAARPAELRAPFPSPSRGAVTLEFALARAGSVSLAILDVGGRQVRALTVAEPRGPGTHRVAWDGLDAAGRRVAAGVYRARLSVEGRTLERRLILTR